MAEQATIPAVRRPMEGGAEPVTLAGGILNIIERAASDPNIDVDKLGRLLEMQERVLAREAEQAFDEAMKAAQEEIRPVVANKRNPQTKSEYADLEALSDAIDPIIHKHGFTLSFGSDASPLADHYRVTCRAAHTGKGRADSHAKDYHADVPIDMTGIKGERNKTTTHGWGSAMTYGRRYLKLLIFDVTTTTKSTRDDDGNRASPSLTDNQLSDLEALIQEVKADKPRFLRFMKVERLEDIPAREFQRAVAALEGKRR